MHKADNEQIEHLPHHTHPSTYLEDHWRCEARASRGAHAVAGATAGKAVPRRTKWTKINRVNLKII